MLGEAHLFERDPMVRTYFVGVSDGTANEQTISNAFNTYDPSTAAAAVASGVEPNVAKEQRVPSLDNMKLVIFMAHAGTGDWSASFDCSRDNSNWEQIPGAQGLVFRNQFTTGNRTPVVITQPFPPGFLVANGVTVNDLFRVRMRFTPAAVSSDAVCAFIMALQDNRAQNLKAGVGRRGDAFSTTVGRGL